MPQVEPSVRRGCLLLRAATQECLFLIPTKALQGSGLVQCSKGPTCTSPHTSTSQGPPCPELGSRVETQCRTPAQEAAPPSPKVHRTPKPEPAKDRNYLGYVGAKAGGPVMFQALSLTCCGLRGHTGRQALGDPISKPHS